MQSRLYHRLREARCASGRLALLPFGIVVAPYLMWADAVVVSLPPLAVHAKDLKPLGVSIALQPAVKLFSCRDPGLSSVFRPVIVDVVDTQKVSLGFATTVATVSAQCLVCLIPNPVAASFVVGIDLFEKSPSFLLGQASDVGDSPLILPLVHFRSVRRQFVRRHARDFLAVGFSRIIPAASAAPVVDGPSRKVRDRLLGAAMATGRVRQ